MLKALSIVSLTTIFLSGCSGGSGGGQESYKFDDKVTAQKVFNSSTISCSGECPAYVGGMTSYTESYKEYSVGVCSLTLISPDSVMANKHCLPSDLNYPGVSCLDRIKIKLPATGEYSAQSLDCDKVLAVSKGDISEAEGSSILQPDWVVLSLKQRVNRPPATINSAGGIRHGDAIHLYPVKYNLDNSGSIMTVNGTINHNLCNADSKSLSNMFFFSPFSSLFAVEKCAQDIIKGNSGSGAFNSANQLIGVFSYTEKPDNYSSTQKFAGGTNTACISHLQTPHNHCQFIDDKKFKEEILSLRILIRFFDFPDTYKIVTSNTEQLEIENTMNKTQVLYGTDSLAKVDNISHMNGYKTLLNESLQTLKNEYIEKFIFHHRVKCIQPQNSSENIQLAARRIQLDSLFEKSDKPNVEILPVIAHIKQKDGSYLVELKTEDKMLQEATDYQAAELACLKEKVSKKTSLFSSFSFFDHKCNDFEKLRSQINTKMNMEERLAFSTNLLLIAWEANSMQIQVPACE